MRIWISGPRIFGGLIRPGISFNLSELTRLVRFGRIGLPVKREDVVVSRKEGPGLNMSVDLAPEALGRIAEVPEPPPKFEEYPFGARVAAWVVFGFAIWRFISMVGCILSAAHGGTCRYYSDGPDAVTACEDGSVIVRHQDGRVDRYETPNAGFERYPGQQNRPVIERRD